MLERNTAWKWILRSFEFADNKIQKKEEISFTAIRIVDVEI